MMFAVWMAAQGGFGYVASLASEVFNGHLLPGLKRGWKIFIVVIVCVLLSFLEAVSTKLISLPINWRDSVIIIGVAMLIFAGSQYWWKKIINPSPPSDIVAMKVMRGPPVTGPSEIKACEDSKPPYK